VVESCHDGDTCRVKVEGKTLKVRFSGIDAPEIKQPEGQAAKLQLDTLILNQPVNLECEGESYDRTTCVVFKGATNVNEEMVKGGFAWDSPRYSKGRYRDFMLKAQQEKIGIWKSTTVSPYCFRHKKARQCSGNPLWMD
jgi:endonuclease YncB( thermonuclease family)